jgi:signal transduction histidine kinase
VVRQAEVIRVALERERAAAKQQRDFVGMVSHEFRTPLAIIDSAAEILGGPYQINERQRAKRIKMIRDSVRRLNDLVDSVLDFTRIDGGALKFQPESIDLSALLRAVVERVEAMRSACRVALSLPGEPLVVFGDPKLLDHVFANLIDNAIKYSPGKSHVFVNLEPAARGGARIVVADQGVGVPEDEIPKLFDRFYRASTASGIHGTGIGLYIVDQFLRLHGGRATLESKVGQGSTFKVYLPAGKAG